MSGNLGNYTPAGSDTGQPKSAPEHHNTGITKYLINDKETERFFHSSGYATAASGANIGASGGSNETFAARQDIDARRQFIKKYNNARVISDARAFDRIRGTVLTGNKSSNNSRAQLSKSAEKSRVQLAKAVDEALISGAEGRAKEARGSHRRMSYDLAKASGYDQDTNAANYGQNSRKYSTSRVPVHGVKEPASRPEPPARRVSGLSGVL